MNQEIHFFDEQLEQAMSGIRDERPDDAAVEAAASRVWAKLAAAAGQAGDVGAAAGQAGDAGAAPAYIGDCAEFQALIPDFKAGKLGETKTLLVRDHLHECVACRRVYQGRVESAAPVVVMPRKAPKMVVRWAVAAAVVASAGATIWLTLDHSGTASGRAIVQAVNGSLFEVTGQGITPLFVGQDLPDGVEIRTAKDSDAVLKLKDGSLVEMRERSGFSTDRSASDLVIRLLRGSVIVQAAKRKAGHLYVSTADCRVAVTGTIFGVDAGAKGSRVSVIQGEVHVEQNNRDNVVQPGGQIVTSPSDLAPEPVSEDIAWSRDHARYDSLLKQLADLGNRLKQVPLPGLRYSSSLLPRLPASTAIYVSIPNLADYLGEAQTVLDRKLSESPALRQWWNANGAKGGAMLEHLRGVSEYLGDEIAMISLADNPRPVFVSEVKREGLAEYLKKYPQFGMAERNGLAVVGAPADVERVAAELDDPKGGIKSSLIYSHAMDEFSRGAGFLLVADASQHAQAGGMEGMKYVVAGERQEGKGLEAQLTIGFSGNRTGLASWLAAPGPMGSLDYVSADATIVGAFLVKDPGTIVDQVGGFIGRSSDDGLSLARTALAKSLGGEFSISLDGPAIPIPAWRLVAEVYNPAAAEGAIEQAAQQYNADAAKDGHAPLEISQEEAGGKVYHRLALANSGPLLVFYYTFADGYLIAGPQRVLVEKALQVKAAGNSILRSSNFVSMMPYDHHANFSGLLFQNLGTTLAPLAGLLAGFASPGGRNNPLSQLSNLKPSLIGAYAEPDKLTFATNGDVLGPAVGGLISGNLHGVAQGALPFLPMLQGQGSRQMQMVH